VQWPDYSDLFRLPSAWGRTPPPPTHTLSLYLSISLSLSCLQILECNSVRICASLVGFEVILAIIMKIPVFWVITLCSTKRSRCFVRIYCLDLQGRRLYDVRTKEMLKLNRNQLRWATELLRGHCHLKGHHFEMGLTDRPICEMCLEKDESSTHILCDCEVIT
jgi:hypothetical protein